MEHDLQKTIAVLERTPAVLNALLRDLPAEWTTQNEGGETWNIVEVLGHLVHGERCDWMTRTRIILEFGESRVFDPFDMQGHVKLIEGKNLNELLDAFTAARAENLTALRALELTPAQLALRGQHPAFGSVVLSQMLATWAVHDMTHLRQISHVMAYQYREAVGPWKEYLGVLRD